ncbi:ABC-type proline/glycine betaine transport system, ATPase component [Streptococcus suis 98HAH33]|nr:ABC-type proline/glycine betaine transport system, ATPase component [Streptococcus suis 05ZYH33]ABP92769.1 ABC-type proline/glycine betaine transport system, ATPase component [Streptococcus suis 98HAH33]
MMIDYQNVSLTCKVSGPILKNLTFDIQEGEFFVLIGPSGSGKTTTLKLINRLIEQTEGEVFFQGKRLKDFDLRELRLETGYVLQQIALFPNMTVAENIALIPEMKGLGKEETLTRMRELLTKVGLEPDSYLDRLPKDLSGGEKQRIGILRAIIANPKVLLMDEPFSALDPISKAQLQDLIKELHEEFKMTTVFVTHDMDEAVKLADRICLMQDGQVVQLGSPDELRNRPANDFVKEFIRARGGM